MYVGASCERFTFLTAVTAFFGLAFAFGARSSMTAYASAPMQGMNSTRLPSAASPITKQKAKKRRRSFDSGLTRLDPPAWELLRQQENEDSVQSELTSRQDIPDSALLEPNSQVRLQQLDLSCWQESLLNDGARDYAAARNSHFYGLKVQGIEQRAKQLCSALGQTFGSRIQILDLSQSPDLDDNSLNTVATTFAVLQQLRLNHCPGITNAGLKAVARRRAASLLEISVAHCIQITDEAIEVLVQSCPRLQSIDISGCSGVFDRSLIALAKLRSLKCVQLNGCSNITDSAVTALLLSFSAGVISSIGLVGCSALIDESLRHMYEQRTISGYKRHSYCKQLHSLTLGATANVTDQTVRRIAAACSSLQLLHLIDMPQVGSDDTLAIIGDIATLTELQLCGLQRVSDGGIHALFNSLAPPALTTLNLQRCTKVTDASLQCIAQKCGSQLTTLLLEGSTGITDIGLKALAAAAETSFDLHTLSISRLSITDDGVRVLLRQCLNLQELTLARCTHVTEKCLQPLRRLHKLKHLNLTGCKGISSFDSLHALPTVTELNLSDNVQLTDSGLANIITIAPALQKLVVSKCTTLAAAGVTSAIQNCFNITMIDTTGCYSNTTASASQTAVMVPESSISDSNLMHIDDNTCDDTVPHMFLAPAHAAVHGFDGYRCNGKLKQQHARYTERKLRMTYLSSILLIQRWWRHHTNYIQTAAVAEQQQHRQALAAFRIQTCVLRFLARYRLQRQTARKQMMVDAIRGWRVIATVLRKARRADIHYHHTLVSNM
jgi:F-box and leucine-rich repeat protein 2/20